MKLSTYVLILLIFTLTGCSYEIELAAEVNADCSVDVMFKNGSPQIRYIAVAEAIGDNFDYGDSVWEVNGNYKKIESFTYGKLPVGFNEVVTPKPLVSGKSYYFIVKGSGGGFGAVKVGYKCLTNFSS